MFNALKGEVKTLKFEKYSKNSKNTKIKKGGA